MAFILFGLLACFLISSYREDMQEIWKFSVLLIILWVIGWAVLIWSGVAFLVWMVSFLA